jgi:hypothetical protein
MTLARSSYPHMDLQLHVAINSCSSHQLWIYLSLVDKASTDSLFSNVGSSSCIKNSASNNKEGRIYMCSLLTTHDYLHILDMTYRNKIWYFTTCKDLVPIMITLLLLFLCDQAHLSWQSFNTCLYHSACWKIPQYVPTSVFYAHSKASGTSQLQVAPPDQYNHYDFGWGHGNHHGRGRG